MKIVVTKECYDEACARVKEYLAKQIDELKPDEIYGSHCLFAVAGEKAGLDVKWVRPALMRLKNGTKYVLPAAARQMLSEFDVSQYEKDRPFPLEKLPAEFDFIEVANRED